jgi:hypothetical protein
MLFASDIASVPADLIKHLITLALAFAGAWFAFKRSQVVAGTKDQPVNVAQPLITRKHIDYAEKLEVEKRLAKLDEKIDGTQDQILTETQALRTDGQNRVVALSELIRAELAVRDTHISNMRDEILHRLDGFTQLVSAHEAILPRVEATLREHMRQYNEQTANLQKRIDDAMRSAKRS